jgi:hypothetical protein
MRLANLGRPGSVLVLLGWGLCLALVAFGAYALLARFVLHGPVTPDSLAEALTRESDSAGSTLGDPGRCRQTAATTWNCSVVDRQGSGGARYTVTVDADRSCWQATLDEDHSEGGMPGIVNGCVHRWQWALTDLL